MTGPAQISLDEVSTYPGNPRRGDIDAIAASLTALGQYRPIVVNRGTITGRPNEILAGNHTAMAARQLGWSRILCHFVDVDDHDAARIVATDNRLGDLATYDEQLLVDLLSSIPTLDGTGYSLEDLDTLHRIIDATVPNGEPGTDVHDEWWDMPDVPELVDGFVPYRKITVAFADEASVQKFSQLIGQQLTDKVKSIWYPPRAFMAKRDYRVVAAAVGDE